MLQGKLQGKRILITRARGQASALASMLEERGAHAVLISTIELAPPESFCALDAALIALRSFDWLLLTSANAVEAFAARARALKLPAHPRKVAAIGPATARAVIEQGIAAHVDLVPERYVAEGFAKALEPHAAGAHMLLVRAAVARDLLPEALAAAGAQVTIAHAYRTVVPPGSIERLQELFRDQPPDAITFTSASTALNLAALLEAAGTAIPAGTVLASIGPITSQAMRELSHEPTVEAAESTLAALVQALASYFA